MELQEGLGGLIHIFIQALLVRAAPLSNLNSEAESLLYKTNKHLFSNRALNKPHPTHPKSSFCLN